MHSAGGGGLGRLLEREGGRELSSSEEVSEGGVAERPGGD